MPARLCLEIARATFLLRRAVWRTAVDIDCDSV